MLKVQEYYTKSKIRKRHYHPDNIKKDELRQYKYESDLQTITKEKQWKNQSNRELKQ